VAPDGRRGFAGRDWKREAVSGGPGWYTLATEDTGDVPVRLIFSSHLLGELEDDLYPQIVNATRFPGVRLVVLTPDAHIGYGVPVGSVIVTDGETGAVAMGPVGFDISCGMVAAGSTVSAGAATPERRLRFNREVLSRVAMGAGERGLGAFGRIEQPEFERIVRGGAEYFAARHGTTFHRERAERDRLPVDDAWSIPWGGPGRPERGVPQLGSLGAGNHFIELQRSLRSDTLHVQIHTGSRGFGHGLATNYFSLARVERPELRDLDLGYFTPESPHHADYLNAVSAAGNFAIVNRLIVMEHVAAAFRATFANELELIYEISHNLVQREPHPEFGEVWVHRKGATRAFPAGHPALAGTAWAGEGHPVLIPGSNQDRSFRLRPAAGAALSAFSVNHGAGRRLSRSAALRALDQRATDLDYRRAGIVVNADGVVPLDEAGAAYKPAREVVDAVVSAGLASVEDELEPLASLKASDVRRRQRR
jgi:tRNA-splicing ligase RtcB (3'-phosphate/5'-hydroxy nucleic acid ligase)